MAGENDRIHSYNGVYRSEAGAPQFYSFASRNGKFINQPVYIPAGGGPAAYDHQGHIVPQNILNIVLNVEMAHMAENCLDEASAILYVTAHAPWLRDAYAYGLAIGAPMFDYEYEDPEARFGNFFSIVTWNPVNLCRAPSDDCRGGAPGDEIDQLVVDYLEAHPYEQGVNGAWLASLNNLIADPENVALITAYLNACSATLAGQRAVGIGYYAFPWEYQIALKNSNLSADNGKGVLIPLEK